MEILEVIWLEAKYLIMDISEIKAFIIDKNHSKRFFYNCQNNQYFV